MSDTQLFNLYSDGGARGNPGPSACGWIAFDAAGALVDFGGEYLGQNTNNYAEYSALKVALGKLARAHGTTKLSLVCHLDSELVVKQLQGVYKIKEPQLARLAVEVKAVAEKFARVEYVHVPREQNKFADRLVNLVLDSVAA